MKHEMHFQLIIVKQVNIEVFNEKRRSESKWIGSIKLYPDIEERIVGSIAFHQTNYYLQSKNSSETLLNE